MDLIQNWPMPKCQVGDSIVWLSKWNVPGEPATAVITRISTRSIECRVFAGSSSTSVIEVRHKDDPQLPMNPWLQQNGAWDFSPQEYRLRRNDAMLKRIAKELAIEFELTPAEEREEEIKRHAAIKAAIEDAKIKQREAMKAVEGTEGDLPIGDDEVKSNRKLVPMA